MKFSWYLRGTWIHENNIRENFSCHMGSTNVEVHRASKLPDPKGSLSKTLSAASVCCVKEEIKVVNQLLPSGSLTERKVEDIVIEQLPECKCTWTLGTKLP